MNYNYNYYLSRNGERFLVPFLLGGLGGAAVVGISRPRPVFVNNPSSYPPYQPYPPYPPYRPYGGYGYSNYNYYY